MRLRGDARWNQTRGDLERILRHDPDGCFLALWDGLPAGTLTTTSYGTELAWIGMVLVAADLRRRGIATALMRRAIDHLRDHRIETIKLDASDEGHGVYRRLGFEDEWIIRRWRRGGAANSDVPAMGSLSSAATELDRMCFGADRASWLRQMATDCRVADAGERGYAMIRSGGEAAHLGPLVATSARAAAQLAGQVLEGLGASAVIWDVPAANPDAEQLARQFGFAPVRTLTRMRLGPAREESVGTHYAAGDLATG